MQKIGVFVCWCGSNIAATVDVEAVSQALSKEPGVVFSTNYQYMCSQTGQDLIQEKVRELGLTGVVVCSCSPRMHENTFRKTCEKAGLNPYMVEIANIREQCSWIHKDKAEATKKAIILGRAAIAKVMLNAPLQAGTSPVKKRALVIGGGIAGIQTALDIADAGFEVDIVEKKPTIGGKMTQIDKTFPTLDCAACILTPKMVDCAQNEKIHIYAYSEVAAVKGFVGNFKVTIRKKARFVDTTKCTGCGLCTEKCPQKKVPNEFNLGLDTRRAIYIPFAQAVPKVSNPCPFARGATPRRGFTPEFSAAQCRAYAGKRSGAPHLTQIIKTGEAVRLPLSVFPLFRAGGDYLLCDVSGHFLIALHLERKARASLRHCAQCDNVIRHLRLRNVRLDYGESALAFGGIHTEHAAAPLVEVADHIAHERIRHGDVELSDRLEQDRIRLRQTFLVRKPRGKLERDLVRIDRMIRSVVEIGGEINHGISRENTLLHSLEKSLLDCGVVSLRHVSADDALREGQKT